MNVLLHISLDYKTLIIIFYHWNSDKKLNKLYEDYRVFQLLNFCKSLWVGWISDKDIFLAFYIRFNNAKIDRGFSKIRKRKRLALWLHLRLSRHSLLFVSYSTVINNYCLLFDQLMLIALLVITNCT